MIITMRDTMIDELYSCMICGPSETPCHHPECPICGEVGDIHCMAYCRREWERFTKENIKYINEYKEFYIKEK